MQKNIIKDISKLTFLYGINSSIPLIISVFLINKIGLYQFGIYSIAIYFSQSLLIIPEYGFSLGAAKTLGQLKNNLKKRSQLFWDVQTIRFLLFLITYLIFIILINYFQIYSEAKSIINLGIFIVIGNLLTQKWFYLGIGNMKLLMLMTVVPKLLSIPLVLIYVRKPEDLRTAFILHIIPILFTSFFSLSYIYSKKFFNGFSINIESTINEFKKDFPLFLSNISGKVYGLGTTIILANFVSPEAVGAYVGADKLRIACQYIITPVEDVLFPRINQLFIKKSKNLFLFIKTSIIYLVGLTFFIFLFVNLFGNLLCKILFPENWYQIFLILKILSPIIFISAFICLLGTNLLIPAGMNKTFSLLEITFSVFHILILIPGCVYFSSKGAAFSFLLSQLFYLIALLVILYFKKTNHLFASNKDSFLLSIIRS